MITPQTLVLWDIDGTLVHTLGAGVRGMNHGFRELYGRDAVLDGIPIAGRTDRAIVTDAFRKLGIAPSDERIHALRDAYLEALSVELARSVADAFGVLPGVVAALDGLAARADIVAALLTGNFERGAEIKLSHFDLWRRFQFGAFGDQHLDRRDLVPVALARAKAAGVVPSSVIVIGDTPLDVDCAHAHGALAVGVATGPYTVQDLKEAGADLTVGTLTELATTGAWVDELRTASRGREPNRARDTA